MTTIIPEPTATTDRMAALVAGLRDLADWLETTPGAPILDVDAKVFPRAEDEADERAEVDRIADLLDVEATARAGGEHYTASRSFGPVEVKAVATTRESMRAYDEHMEPYRARKRAPAPAETPAPAPVCTSWCTGRHNPGDICRLTVGAVGDHAVVLVANAEVTRIRLDEGPDAIPTQYSVDEAQDEAARLRGQDRNDLADLIDKAVTIAEGGAR